MLEERSPSVHPVFLKQAYILLPAPSSPQVFGRLITTLGVFFKVNCMFPTSPFSTETLADSIKVICDVD